MEDLDQPWMNDDRDYDDDVVVERDEEVEQEPIEVVQEELDDEYAREYFRKFEPDSDNDKNERETSYKSIRAVRKYCKERGLPYLRHNGYQQPARNVKDACMCFKFCYAKFMEDTREKMLNNLLELSAEGQNIFLICHIEVVPAHRPKHGKQQKSVRNYYLPSNSGRVRVCKMMFANTFDLSDKRVRVLNHKAETGAYDGWLRKFRSSIQEAGNVPLEEQESSHDVDDVELNSPQDPISNDHPTKNQSRVGSDDESDVELVSSIVKSDNVSAEPKPLLDDVFLDRYFQQQYEVNSMQDELGSSNTETPNKVKNTPLEPCSCVVYQCTHWFTEDWRLKIYSRYAMLPPAKQVQFLQDHTEQIPKKRAKTDSSRRTYSQLYFIPTTTGRTRVCKVMFLNTFRINDHKIRDLNSRNEETPEQATDLDPQEGGNTSRVISKFAFDPTLIDPLALTEAESPPRKKRRSSKLIEESQSGTKLGNTLKSTETIKPKQRSEMEVTKTQSSSDDEDDGPSNDYNQPKSHQPPPAELDDAFLADYFLSYENNDRTKVRKSWLNLKVDEAVPSACSCQRQCYSKFPDEARSKIFSRFVKLTPINQQRFLYRHVQVQHIPGAVTRRKKSYTYFLPSKTGLVTVCYIMFQNVYRVTHKKMRGLVKRHFLGDDPSFSTQTAQEDGSDPGVLVEDVVENDFADIDDVSDAHLLLYPDTTDFNQSDEFDDLQTSIDVGDDEVEVKDSCELLSIEPHDEYEASNAEDTEFSYAALDGVELVFDEPNCPMNETVPIIPEIDDEFLDEYFIQFEMNDDDQGGLRRRKIKPMTKGSPFDDHIVMEACSCVHFMCYAWLTDDLRQKLYGRFVRLSPLSQRLFLRRHIRRECTKRKRAIMTRRNYSLYYFIPTRKKQFQVCKVMFMNTFKVTDKKLRGLLGNNQFGAPEETSYDEIEVDVDINSLHVLSSQEEPQEIDIKEEPVHSNGLHGSENFEPPSESVTDQAIAAPSSIHCSDDEATLSGSETDRKQPTIENEDEDDNEGAVYRKQFLEITKESPLPILDDNVRNPQSDLDRPTVSPVELDEAFLNGYLQGLLNPPVMRKRSKKLQQNTSDLPSTLVPAACCCARQCHLKFPYRLRQMIFDKYLELSCHDQKHFVRSLMDLRSTKLTKEATELWKKVYHLPSNTGRVVVCQSMFRNTFNLSHTQLQVIKNSESDSRAKTSETGSVHGININTVHSEDPPDDMNNEEHDSNNIVDCTSDAEVNDDRDGFSKPINPLEQACSCLQACSTKVPAQMRRALLDKYTMLSKRDRIEFLNSCIKCGTPRQQNTSQKECRRKFTYAYSLPNDGPPISICKVMFCHVFGLTDKKLRTIRNKRSIEDNVTLHDVSEAAIGDGTSEDANFEYDPFEMNSEELNEMIVGE
ncbi:uncharacterized protein LOC115263253 [Aedes albopictus]|uniref:Uncharacterized protein n=1 Tax=Aedes albopictus TaxID=7160 RepID=A0ABM1YDE3_AEDAL